MKAVRIIFTDKRFCCENCRGNAIAFESHDGYYENRGCPLCHSHVLGVPDEGHFWKVHEKINQMLEDEYNGD